MDFILQEFTTDNSCLDNVYLNTVDRFTFWIGGPIALISSLFLIIGYIRFKELRKQPGDIILGICISDSILCIHWMVLATWPYAIGPDGETPFCQINGYFSTTAGILDFLYNVSFCLYLIVTLQNALKQSRIPKKTFHIINILFAIVYVIAIGQMGLIGKTAFGTCSIKGTCQPGFFAYFGGVVVLVYVVIGIATLYYVKKYVNRCKMANVKRADFLIYYLRYTIASCVIFFLTAITNFLAVAFSQSSSFGNYIQSAGNAVKLCTPLVLSFIRYKDPLIQKIMARIVFFWRKKKDPYNESILQEFIFNEMSQENKKQITYTLLSCVQYALSDQQVKPTSSYMTSEKKLNNPFKHEKVFIIDDEMIRADLPASRDELTRAKTEIASGTLKVYAQHVFQELIDQDREFLNPVESLDFKLNREQLEAAASASEGKGGKSGEFFFFSSDKKLIIKTVPDMEKDMMISILERYFHYMQHNPNTLISKVYGVYTYENSDVNQKFNMILMKNICGFPSKFVKRTYDMKGSKHDRQVLRKQSFIDKQELQGTVLKDLDFINVEKRLFLTEDIRQLFLDQVLSDSQFFRSVSLIDYSFMVFCVDKAQYWKENGRENKIIDHTSLNKLASIPSTNPEDAGIYYNMGIIDYLQPYNFSKKIEKYFKRCKKLDPNLDTSTQDPVYYQERFIEFIRKICSVLPNESRLINSSGNNNNSN